MPRNNKIPKAVIQSGEERFSWLKDVQNLSIGELIEIYAYAEAIVETVREPLVILDKDMEVRSANKAFFDTFHTTKEETYGKYFYDINGGEWDIPSLRELISKILPNRTALRDFEVEHDFERIGRKIMLLNARRIVLEENETDLILLAIEDVTRRRDLERRQSEFIRLASHELRTPVQIMQTEADLLKTRQQGDQKDRSSVEKIHAQSKKLKELIDRLLQTEAPHTDILLEKKKIDLPALVHKVVLETQSVAKDHTIVAGGNSKLNVIADTLAVEQVLSNLLTNAVKYSPEGTEVITKVTRKNGEAVVSVQDFGSGIDKKEVSKIFEQYYQIEKKDPESFGLGLYIAGKIVKQHGGRIWAESTRSKGSTFYFTLPLTEPK